VLRDPLGLLFVGVLLVAAGLTAAARHGIQVLYDQGVAASFAAAQPSLAAVAGTEVPAGPSASVPGSLEEAAQAGIDALSPIVDTVRLRGTFLEDADAQAFQQASAIQVELEELDGGLRDQVSATQVAYRIQRLVRRVPEAGGRLVVAGDAPGRADALWTRAYAYDLQQTDASFSSTLDELAAWRQAELPALVAAGRAAAAQERVEQYRAEVERMVDRVRSLPTPPAAIPSARTYLEALKHVDRALAALDDYSSNPSAGASVLQDSADQIAAFRAERQAPLAAVSSLR
jgi:hypothetical protein